MRIKMASKVTAVVFSAVCAIVAGCQAKDSIWSKPGYQPAPVTNGASRTYTPIESVSPYQQNNSGYGGASAR